MKFYDMNANHPKTKRAIEETIKLAKEKGSTVESFRKSQRLYVNYICDCGTTGFIRRSEFMKRGCCQPCHRRNNQSKGATK